MQSAAAMSGRQRSRGDGAGQFNSHPRALGSGSVHAEVAAHQAADSACERQAEARPLLRMLNVLTLAERIEQRGQQRRVDPRPAVAYREGDPGPAGLKRRRPRRDDHLAMAAIVGGIVDQQVQRLLELLRIGLEVASVRIDDRADGDASGAGAGAVDDHRHEFGRAHGVREIVASARLRSWRGREWR